MSEQQVDLRRGIDPIPGLDSRTVGDFWAWAYSDVLSNRNRAIFAEFIVGSALGVTDRARVEWDRYDLLYENRGVEVKSAAYIQSWGQKAASVIRFDVARKRGWSADTNTSAKDAGREAACYVFCLFQEPYANKRDANVLDVGKWQFFVVPTKTLDDECPNKKTIGLKEVLRLCGQPVGYGELRQHARAALELAP